MSQIGEVGLGLAETGGHDVFEDDVEASRGAGEGEAAAGGASTDHGYGSDDERRVSGDRLRVGRMGHLVAVAATAVMTDS